MPTLNPGANMFLGWGFKKMLRDDWSQNHDPFAEAISYGLVLAYQLIEQSQHVVNDVPNT